MRSDERRWKYSLGLLMRRGEACQRRKRLHGRRHQGRDRDAESYRDDQVFLHIPAGCQRTCGPPVSHDLSQGRELAHHQIVGNSLRVGSLSRLVPWRCRSVAREAPRNTDTCAVALIWIMAQRKKCSSPQKERSKGETNHGRHLQAGILERPRASKRLTGAKHG